MSLLLYIKQGLYVFINLFSVSYRLSHSCKIYNYHTVFIHIYIYTYSVYFLKILRMNTEFFPTVKRSWMRKPLAYFLNFTLFTGLKMHKICTHNNQPKKPRVPSCSQELRTLFHLGACWLQPSQANSIALSLWQASDSSRSSAR